MVVIKETFDIIKEGDISKRIILVDNLNLAKLIAKLETKDFNLDEKAPLLPLGVKDLEFKYDGNRRLLKQKNLYLLLENKPANEGVYCTIFWYGKDEKRGRELVDYVRNGVIAYFDSLDLKLNPEQLKRLDLLFKNNGF